MQPLKQSTAATIIVGPILDSAGAEYTSAVIGDLSISKNGTEAALASAATLTHVSNGHYTLVLTTGNTDTLGRLDIRCNKSGYQLPPLRYEVLSATAFDTLVTNGTLASTTSGRTILTNASGYVSPNWGDVGNPTAIVDLDNTSFGSVSNAIVGGFVEGDPIVEALMDLLTNNYNSTTHKLGTVTTVDTATAVTNPIDLKNAALYRKLK